MTNLLIDEAQLRPLERRIRRLVREDTSVPEIARRFRRSPDFVERVIGFSELSGRTAIGSSEGRLRPVERRVLRWREAGVGHDEIGERFHRSAGFVAQVERLARYKLAR